MRGFACGSVRLLSATVSVAALVAAPALVGAQEAVVEPEPVVLESDSCECIIVETEVPQCDVDHVAYSDAATEGELFEDAGADCDGLQSLEPVSSEAVAIAGESLLDTCGVPSACDAPICEAADSAAEAVYEYPDSADAAVEASGAMAVYEENLAQDEQCNTEQQDERCRIEAAESEPEGQEEADRPDQADCVDADVDVEDQIVQVDFFAEQVAEDDSSDRDAQPDPDGSDDRVYLAETTDQQALDEEGFTTDQPDQAEQPDAKNPADTPETSDAPETSDIPATSGAPETPDAPDSLDPAGPSDSAAPADPDGQDVSLQASATAAKQTGWVTKGGKTYYYDANGKRVTGKTKIDGKWYYLRPDTGAKVESKFVYIADDKTTCYFAKNGTMVLGEKRLYGYDYLFDGKTGGRAEAEYVKTDSKTTVYYDDLGHKAYGARMVDDKPCYFDTKTGAKYTSAQVLDMIEKKARSVLGTDSGTPFEDALLAAGGRLCWGTRGAWCATYIWWAFNQSGAGIFLANGTPLSEPEQYYNYYAKLGKSYWRDASNGASMKGVQRGDLVFIDYGVMSYYGIYDRITHLAYCIKTDDKGFYCIEGNIPNAKIEYRTYTNPINRGYARLSY